MESATTFKKGQGKALREAEDLNIELSKEDLGIIEELSLRGLQGKMEDATYFEDNTDIQKDWLKDKKIEFKHWNAYRNLLSLKPNWTEGENGH